MAYDPWKRQKKPKAAATPGELLMEQFAAVPTEAPTPQAAFGQIGGMMNAPWQRAGTPEGGQPLIQAMTQVQQPPGMQMPTVPGQLMATATPQAPTTPLQQVTQWQPVAPEAGAAAYQPTGGAYAPTSGAVSGRYPGGFWGDVMRLQDLYGIGRDEARKVMRMTPSQLQEWEYGQQRELAMQRYFTPKEVGFRQAKFLESQRRYIQWYWGAEARAHRERQRQEQFKAQRVEELRGWKEYYSFIGGQKLPPQADEYFASVTRFNEMRRRFETEVGAGASEKQWESWLAKRNFRDEWRDRGPRATGERPGVFAGRMTAMRY